MMWYDVVWYGMLCGVVWCGVVWCGLACGVVWYGVVWCGMVVRCTQISQHIMNFDTYFDKFDQF